MKKTISLFCAFLLFTLSSFSYSQVFPNRMYAALQTGLGFPVGGLSQWYSATPNVGANIGIPTKGGQSVEIEYFYLHYLHGSIEEKLFYWPVDRQYHKSPDAKADMAIHSFLVNFLFPYKTVTLAGKTISLYSSVGSGFYAYSNAVSGLTYPGQSKKPIRLDFHLPPVEDDQVAIGLNLGLGSQLAITEKMNLDLRLRYNLILGSIRPFEDWEIKEVFPVQMFDLKVGVIYLF